MNIEFNLGFVTTDYTHITDIQEREMETLSMEALSVEMLIEELLN